jgi:hypothetical protein
MRVSKKYILKFWMRNHFPYYIGEKDKIRLSHGVAGGCWTKFVSTQANSYQVLGN